MAWEDLTSQLSEDDLGVLYRDELGPLNFAPAIDNLRRIRRWAENLAQQDPGDLYQGLRDEVEQRIKKIIQLADRIRGFDPQQANSPMDRLAVIGEVEAEKDWWARNVAQYARAREIDLAQLLQEAGAATRSLQTQAAEMDALLSRVRVASGKAGADKLSAHYRTQVDAHESQANLFLKWGIGALGATLLAGLGLFVLFPPTADDSSNWLLFVRSIVPRLFIVGVLGYVVAFAARNYRVNKHLQVVNEQRRTALDTYPLFTESVDDAATRGLIAIELLRATVGSTDTGYISGGSEKTILESQPAITQLLRPPSG